ncbi:asparagine synthase (glutamine-hydrolyzing) [Streptomyces sp. XY006]|uniref:asparagine synthase (glutamine-hydrolyzing) n=1 Tax=Streptomyces sp. XY006 TaxID=2021410 RepID=UPI0015C642B6|nr:asparagine synthase (glutamine-hydrolyzing) [Streptomyces sp. XY006]
MCGLAGFVGPRHDPRAARGTLDAMSAAIRHRGPDSTGFHVDERVAFAFTRLAINDLEAGDQPMYDESRQIVAMTTGEIYNYRELRDLLVSRGHTLRTRCDTEVIPHLYEEFGRDFVSRLDGQFAVVLYDHREQLFIGARDHFGVTPLFYAHQGGELVFGSEIKAMLEHPAVPRRVDLVGLDQVFTLPGLVSPRTMFEGVHSVPPGTAVAFRPGDRPKVWTYWDLAYPRTDADVERHDEAYYVRRVEDLLVRSVEKRLQSDVEVGLYLSGGLDSSLVGAIMRHLMPDADIQSFAAAFPERELSESDYQRLMSGVLDTRHTERFVHGEEIASRLRAVVRHTECPLKESFNSAAHALSEAVHRAGVKVVLTGQGADELFGGYIGYRFDQVRRTQAAGGVTDLREARMRESLWGDENFFYERNDAGFGATKARLYSAPVRERQGEIDCLGHPLVDRERLTGLHDLHRRSYLDLKLRLADHLLGDHGDRMVFAHSVESRHPFLDRELVEFLATVPPELKLKGLEEKYLLKQVAREWIPRRIVDREKFGFTAPGSPHLIRQDDPAIEALLSRERIEADGYFDPDQVERLVREYATPGFRINVPFETDLLMTVLTFNLLLDLYDLPAYSA